jgi:hypothetical protein
VIFHEARHTRKSNKEKARAKNKSTTKAREDLMHTFEAETVVETKHRRRSGRKEGIRKKKVFTADE